ncbi:M3 family oligoendopeptidase [Spirillospora sp. NPDC047279]|uniref:M3 family oligoendopeptidase n=1 Tax=Spirillospora sp. NPDC047279 TaxID=3155478 RepID=UPI0033FE844A
MTVSWDLGDLISDAGRDDPPRAVDVLLAEAARLTGVFAARFTGALAELDGPGLVGAMRALAEIRELTTRAATYADLSFAVDTADPARGALRQHVVERRTAIDKDLLFFRLEWAALDDARAGELLAADGLGFARHHLRTLRRDRPHLLTEPEERILAEKAVSGRAAWVRLHEERTAAIEVALDDGPASLETALARLSSAGREVRRDTAERVTAALEPGIRTRAYAFNMLLADKASDDRLRGHPHWLSARNLANEASDASVEALLDAVRRRHELPRRWYRLKAELLGLDRLADYDRTAAVAGDQEDIPWADARDLVNETYADFSPELGAIVRRFHDERWIDAPVRPAKRGGAFCAYATPGVHPYIMLNYTHTTADVLTLAHELGHGVHGALAARQGIFHMATPLTLAETASVFGETLVFHRLLERASTPESRLSLLARSIEGSIKTVFRQVALNRFEHLAHTGRREEGELSVERLGDLWTGSQREMFGDSVELTGGYRHWWSYIPHFVSTPGYVYAYAYGQLLALAVYARYEEEGPAFVPRYLDLLGAGGSRGPEELGRMVGVDLADPTFWDRGLDLVERRLDEAETAARA